MKKFKRFIARNANGMYWGGGAGLIAFLLREKITFLQNIMVGNAWLGNLATYIFLGATIGLVFDMWWKPLK